jgi:murein DD-endopeptidase MepM/ murein hydrolase activator NlpD
MIRAGGCAAVVCALILSFAPGRAQDASPIRLGQGEVVLVPLDLRDATEVRGHFRGRPVAVFPGGSSGGWHALVAADLEDPPGHASLVVELAGPRATSTVRLPVEVGATQFGTQTLSLPRRMVDLDAKTLARANAERARVSGILERRHPARLWRGPFLLPTDGQIARSFGMRRLLNGQPRSPHSGEDIVAPAGTPIRAAQDGIVRLEETHFFSGRSLILDHGLGLFTLYFHLSEAAVLEGAAVKREQVIGTVGASGRVTGPHLHWAAVLGGARVNPLDLLALPSE